MKTVRRSNLILLDHISDRNKLLSVERGMFTLRVISMRRCMKYLWWRFETLRIPETRQVPRVEKGSIAGAN